MVKHFDLKAALDFIRKGYTKGKEPFCFTVPEMASAINISEKKTKEVLARINDRAQFWRGSYLPNYDNLVVSAPVFERVKDWFK
ncbi:hypothetical protein PSDVSF_24740 [Pseudodesulfovibrio sediminis]|uniref:Uncharacterized protein n=2 Tax=Pseudodesulfovibrio sediminis TaxID=2810563 RepID=A0ABN6ES93_9BACT|nr:hypothetical protein PSDVSF_24740 [Pseudodesulfovibrio sediminis]